MKKKSNELEGKTARSNVCRKFIDWINIIIHPITFGTTFGTRKLFSKKYTHAEVLIK